MNQTYLIGISDPFSDTLTALGLQHLLAELLQKQGDPYGGIRWTDCGAYIRLDLPIPIRPETVENLGEDNYVMGGLRFIRTIKNTDSLPDDLPPGRIDDYEDVKAQNAAFYDEIRQSGSSTLNKPIVWDVLRTVNPAALPGWTNIMSDWWKLRSVQSQIIDLLLKLYSELPNPIDDAMSHWKSLNKENRWGVSESATCQQFFNPDQGKGQNKVKSDGISISNMKGFWLTEYLKMVGFYRDAITKTVAGGKDRKIFVVAPRDISYATYDEVMSKFKPTVTSETSVRFDILAALRFAEILLAHYQQPENQDLFAQLLGSNLQHDLIGGFHTTFYLNLGNAVATMNVSSIALPGWITIVSAQDIETYRSILDEFISFTRQFEEKNSDAFALLQHLRDFVSGDDLTAFFKLTTTFPAYYIGMRERGKYAYQLTTTTIERIIFMTDKKLAAILEKDGFKNIAYAIRHSTVIPQYRKAGGDRLYDIRYGLGQDLTRVARKGKEMAFITVLSDFMHKYNAENARIYEVRNVQYRRNITTDDINEIVQLIDDYDAPTIAQMLVAYGYARMPKETDDQDTPEAID